MLHCLWGCWEIGQPVIIPEIKKNESIDSKNDDTIRSSHLQWRVYLEESLLELVLLEGGEVPQRVVHVASVALV